LVFDIYEMHGENKIKSEVEGSSLSLVEAKNEWS
jgi:hypothetical protein